MICPAACANAEGAASPNERTASAHTYSHPRERITASATKLLVPDAPDVLAQQVAAEVAVEVAPHRVDVVAVVLRVVVLDEERRSLDAVVVLLSALGLTGPREPDLLEARFLQLRRAVRGDVRSHEAD